MAAATASQVLGAALDRGEDGCEVGVEGGAGAVEPAGARAEHRVEDVLGVADDAGAAGAAGRWGRPRRAS